MTSKATFLAVCVAALTCLACSHAGADNPSAPAGGQKPASQSTAGGVAAKEADVLSRARSTITKYQLTRLPVDCLKLAIEDTSATVYEVTVYELHNAKCGGDPQTQPRLFGLQLSRTDSKVWTDARSDDGEFEPLQ